LDVSRKAQPASPEPVTGRNRASAVSYPKPERSQAVSQAIAKRLMTFDELQQRIGKGPKADLVVFGKVVHKNSIQYKAVGQALAAYHQTADILLKDLPADQDARKQLTAQLEKNLDAVIKAGEAYQKKAGKRGKTKVSEVLGQFIADASRLDEVLSDADFSRVDRYLSLDQALYAKQCGIRFADCKFDVFNDAETNHFKSKEQAGSGAVNSVAKLVYADGKDHYFKEEKANDTSAADEPELIGIAQNDPRYGNRNIASQLISDQLGLNVIAKSCFTVHQGKIGLLMDGAEGKNPVRNEYGKITDEIMIKNLEKEYQTSKKERKYFKREKNGEWFKLINNYAPNPPWPEGTKPSPQLVASLHQQLNGLEWCDVVTGQTDRHGYNYFVNVDGNKAAVTGIDNDFAFGKKQTNVETLHGNCIGKPKLIDEQTFQKLTGMTFDKDLLPGLKGLLAAEEIAAAKSRFAQVQAHAAQLFKDGCVVSNWETWRSPGTNLTATEYLMADNKGKARDNWTKYGSYFDRDFGELFQG
jgi:hypothetical protein